MSDEYPTLPAPETNRSEFSAGDALPKPVYAIFDKAARRENPQPKPPQRPKRKAATATAAPIVVASILADESDKEWEPGAAAAKKPRKPRTKGVSKGRTAKKAKQSTAAQDEPTPADVVPSSSALQSIASMRTDVDPVTASAAPALLVPSSPPAAAEVSADEAVIDPNHDRRKRQKMTPPKRPSWVKFRVKPEAGRALDSSPASVHTVTGNGENLTRSSSPVSYDSDSNLLTIRVNGKIQPKDLLPKAKDVPSSPVIISSATNQIEPPSSPSLPLSPATKDPKNIYGHGVSKDVTNGVQTTYNPETNVFSILNSSPIRKGISPRPASPALVAASPPPRANAFSLLGKKSKPAKVELEDKENTEKKEKPARKERAKRKTKTKQSDVGPYTVEENAEDFKPAVLPKPSGPEPKKAMHPFFNSEKRRDMIKAAQTVEAENVHQSEGQEDGAPVATDNTAPKSQPERIGHLFSNWNRSQDGENKSLRDLNPMSHKMLKIPGSTEAPWPAPGTAHVRGLSPPPCATPISSTSLLSKPRKLKDKQTVVAEEEDILHRMAKSFPMKQMKQDILSEDYEEKQYINIPSEVRLPKRKVVTGSELQEMMRPRIAARLPHPNAALHEDPDSDSSVESAVPKKILHPAHARLYHRLREELTPFDRNICETVPWETKYAPTTSGEVLQSGREMCIFREWLLELKTDKVSTTKKAKIKAKVKGAIKKKRKKKDDELDGFVVTSEEELNLMDELTDPEEEDWLNPNPKMKKSAVRSGDKANELNFFLGKSKEPKKTNTIVLSGPSGSGKTAAVYAVAKEMGYAVFEVSPGTRRNGKDVLDLVGEMSRNHLVHQAKPSSEKVNPFTRAKVPKQAIEEEDEITMRQQQSLILLEEVDILFEEDRTFWTAVITLMAKSKRPIVLTCNDESLVPFETLALHAVLRFSVPPEDLVVDHLLLLCANEGHVLERDTVRALVKSTGNDIRESLMQLEFFCQMGVGDRKGGLDWQLIRWPKGIDVAPNGETYRVISIDTYRKGMGWIDNSPSSSQDNVWRGVWEDWGVDIGASLVGLESWAEGIAGKEHQHLGLVALEEFLEARSAADSFAGLAMSSDNEPRLDATQPPRNQKTQLDDPIGYTTLQTDRFVVPDSVETDMSVYVRSTARMVLQADTAGFTSLERISEDTIIDAIVHRSDNQPIAVWDYQEGFASLSKTETMFASTPASAHSCVYPSMTQLAVEVAPWVRTIMRNDVRKEEDRRKVSNLLSHGGKRRKTRAAMLATAGGDRGRKERWFRGLRTDILRTTAGEGWKEAVNEVTGIETDSESATSRAVTEDSV